MVPTVDTDPIPMGSLEVLPSTLALLQGSQPLDNLEAVPEQDLAAALKLLQQAHVLQYQHSSSSNKINIFGTNTTHIYSLPRRTAAGHRKQELANIRSALSTVLCCINTCPDVSSKSRLENTFEQDQKKGLIDIYCEIPSPQPSNVPADQLASEIDSTTQSLLDSIVTQDAPDGMRTKIYQYQKHSLWKMIKRELCPGSILDPSVIPMTGIDGKDYIIDFSDNYLGVYRFPVSKWDDVRGGILCEDMGTGKTCICIALILLTRHQFSMPPSPSTLFLPFPSATASASTSASISTPAPLKTIKSKGIDFRRFREHMSAHGFSEDTPVFYHHNDTVQGHSARLNELKQNEPETEIYLSRATLVIVPDTLVDQWCNEIIKHAPESALKRLELTSATEKIPEAKQLASYEMVLISQSRFAKEYARGTYSHDQLKDKPQDCDCQELYRRCLCPRSRTIPPLMQVRWKRVIVDEGHSMSSDLSDHALLASKLHADRRWICTGTPTSNLANLVPRSKSLRTWTDKSDLTRLASLAAFFLQVGPYANNKHLFLDKIRNPFMEGKAGSVSLAALSSVRRLRHLLERLMTRNRPEDVRKFVPLPPLHEHVVILSLERFQILSLNFHIALIQANAVLSQRGGRDYFFAPNNLHFLRRTIDNLDNCCFWYSGGGESYTDQVRYTLENVQHALEVHSREGKYSPADVALLEGVVETLQLALSDDSWNTLIAAREMGYFCRLPETMQQEVLIPSSSLRCTVPGGEVGEKACIMLADQIRSLNRKMRQEQVPALGERPDTIEYNGAEQISQTSILSSTSSKLNYIISQILQHHQTEKSIVFCQNSNAIYYIQEYLTLAKVRCLTYHKQGMTQSERSSNIMTFNTSENVAAIIMDVQHAAFGIDLSSATRVYFVSPVWQTATMRQAIKRAHRIGQTRPVYIETLVIRGSFEETIWNKRIEMDGELEPPLPSGPDESSASDSSGRGGSKTIKIEDPETTSLHDIQAKPSTPSHKKAGNGTNGKFRELFSHLELMPSSTERREYKKYSLSDDHVPIESTIKQENDENAIWFLQDLPVPLITVPRDQLVPYGWDNRGGNLETGGLEVPQDDMVALDNAAVEDCKDDMKHTLNDLLVEDHNDSKETVVVGLKVEDRQDEMKPALGADLQDRHYSMENVIDLTEDYMDGTTGNAIDLTEDDMDGTTGTVIDLTEDDIDHNVEVVVDWTTEGTVDDKTALETLVELKKEEDNHDENMALTLDRVNLGREHEELEAAEETRAFEEARAAGEERNVRNTMKAVTRVTVKHEQSDTATSSVQARSSSPPSFPQVKRETDVDPPMSIPSSKRVRFV
ncbi:hypothetical protein BGZ81_003201 [Podila clonocystis]|nr:hypothetical protein BGZ81_003201 [Podila clonocystis]